MQPKDLLPFSHPKNDKGKGLADEPSNPIDKLEDALEELLNLQQLMKMMMEFQKSQMQMFKSGISTMIDTKLAGRDPISQQSIGGGQHSQPISTIHTEISDGSGGGFGLREDIVDIGATGVRRP
ncbi:hypothetical protein R1flu_021225 [Riccia fluitans]|uniref:Uncharacterized protein n=1 Tax=Riccia fluitans TaxID=41844 RepID=A0ABD1ZPA1_9MARC